MFENLEMKEIQHINGGLVVAPIVYAVEIYTKILMNTI